MSAADDAAAVLLLAGRLVDTDARPLPASELWALVARVEHPGRLLGAPASALEAECGLAAELAHRAARLLDGATGLAFALDELRQSGIRSLTPFDDGYPARLRARLGPAAPPVLHVAGPTQHLRSEGIAVVGSRDVSPEGVAVARAVAAAAAANGDVVISGGARGVDQQAIHAAVERGGAAVGVLADSLQRALRAADTRRIVLEGQATLCTPYRPDAPFSTGTAMGRNKIVYALARTTLVVATDAETGGTWSGATEALKKGYGTVAVWRGDGEGPGNAALEALGALPVTAPDDVLHLTAPARTDAAGLPSGPAPDAEQLHLGL